MSSSSSSQPNPEVPAEDQSEYQKGHKQFNTKQRSEYFDPCQEAANRSYRCLARNQGDKDMCADYFQAYRDCKKRWTDERKEEKRKASRWF
ncbi:cytochrome c oxidase-assembly factor cox-23 [Geopyxis carbonaria]|nr:cytochrome c oxidase-assembly factor cox-23 [Geopyxis carbonaria]